MVGVAAASATTTRAADNRRAADPTGAHVAGVHWKPSSTMSAACSEGNGALSELLGSSFVIASTTTVAFPRFAASNAISTWPEGLGGLSTVAL